MSCAATTRLLLLGRDHGDYGRYELRRPTPDTACALTVGADPASPSRAYKGDLAIPNEDALLLVEQGPRVLLAVADAHFGHRPSHDLLAALDAAVAEVPAAPGELAALLRGLAAGPPAGDYPGRTSLLVAVLDRAAGGGFGWSFGDSSCAVCGPGGARWPVNAHSHDFVSLVEPATLAPEDGDPFAFRAGPGELVLAFTDGIDGCHYGYPETSVGETELCEVFTSAGADPEGHARRLVELALGGVRGAPGGQDNIALVVAAAG